MNENYDESGSRRKDPTATSGCVNFPKTGEGYENLATGGMYVQLIALEKKSPLENWWEDMFVVCWGGSNTTLEYQEGMAGTDTLRDEFVPYSEDIDTIWGSMVAEKAHATTLLFPNLYDSNKNKQQRQRSVPVLSSVVLGSTGATWCKGERDFWCCTYDDLTLEGKTIYDSFKTLYGERAGLHLITWMDEG